MQPIHKLKRDYQVELPFHTTFTVMVSVGLDTWFLTGYNLAWSTPTLSVSKLRLIELLVCILS